MQKGTLKCKGGKSFIHFTADTENVHMLMKLVLSCNHRCLFLSVAQLLNDQPKLPDAVTERDLNVSETETSRQPPPNPPAGGECVWWVGWGGREEEGVEWCGVGVGVLGFWGFGVLGFWGFGVLGFWGFGFLGLGFRV